MLVSLFSNESNEIASKNVKSSENEVPSEFLASRHAIFYLDGNCKRAASENAATRPALNSVDPGERKREREEMESFFHGAAAAESRFAPARPATLASAIRTDIRQCSLCIERVRVEARCEFVPNRSR